MKRAMVRVLLILAFFIASLGFILGLEMAYGPSPSVQRYRLLYQLEQDVAELRTRVSALEVLGATHD